MAYLVTLMLLFIRFSLDNVTTYRPTNEQCLMRLTTQSEFCKPCLEGLWLSLLRRVDLIEALDFRPDECSSRVTVQLILVPLGALRQNQSLIEGETYEITWRKDGEVIISANNSTSIDFASSDPGEVYEVDVILHTPDVRRDDEGRLRSHRSFSSEYSVLVPVRLLVSYQLVECAPGLGRAGKPDLNIH